MASLMHRPGYSQAVSRLESLPLELFQLIADHLILKRDDGLVIQVQDLSRLSRTSKAICAAVEPLLYEGVHFLWQNNERHPPVHLLVRTIIMRAQIWHFTFKQ